MKIVLATTAHIILYLGKKNFIKKNATKSCNLPDCALERFVFSFLERERTFSPL